jgi:uncharacterized damage-inducible protein DinB
MDLLAYVRLQAHANRLANHRLHHAMRALSLDDWDAPRTGFFPSLSATLNHILGVDTFYLAALHEEVDMVLQWENFEPAHDLVALTARQAASDERLIDWCDAADAAALDTVVAIDRGERVDHDPAARVLAHLFAHQIHHRGQAHAMLSGTTVRPPQLDEFLLDSDARHRQGDLAALHWTEPRLLGRSAPH